MKQIIAGFLLISTIALASCGKDNDERNDSAAQVEASLSGSTWRVNTFIFDGQSNTAALKPYTFLFNAGGALQASNGVRTTAGTWKVIDGSPRKVDIDFAGTTIVPLKNMSQIWSVATLQTSILSLLQVSGGNTNNLALEK